MTLAEWHEFLGSWVEHVLDGRADKSWAPSLYAHSRLARQLGVVAGIPVQANDELPDRDLILMGEGTRGQPMRPVDPEAGSYFEEMARYSGITVQR